MENRPVTPKRKSAAWLLILILMAAGTAAILTNPMAVVGQSPLSTPDWEEQAINELLQALANPALDGEMRASLEGKLNALQAGQQSELQAQAVQPPKPADICAARPQVNFTEEPRRTGIIPEGPIPFRASDVSINNQWQEQYTGYWVHAYAGALAENPAQGILIIEFEGSPDLGGRFLTPNADGALTIRAATAARLTLESAGGTLYYFDIPALQYVENLEARLPEAALPAPPQPTPGPCD